MPAIGDDNTVCTDVSQCTSTQYQVAAATATTDAVCVENVICGGLTVSQGSSSPTMCTAQCAPCGANQAMQMPASGGACPTCTNLQAFSSTTASISSVGTSLTLDASAINAKGVDLVGWNQALQQQLQATQSAAITQQAANDANRVRLEALVATLVSRVTVLEATASSLVAIHRGQ